MDDITNQLNQILSDPNSMAQIQNIMSGLGLGGANNTQVPAPNNSVPNNPMPSPVQNQTPQPPLNNNTEMLGMITKIAPLLSQIRQEDDTSRLLTALRPMLSEPRRDKIDQAVKILQLMKLFPLLKDSGMLSNVLGGLF